MDTLPQRYTSTKALVVEKPGAAFVLQDVILGELRPKEILVEMKYTGICHTVRHTVAITVPHLHTLLKSRNRLGPRRQGRLHANGIVPRRSRA